MAISTKNIMKLFLMTILIISMVSVIYNTLHLRNVVSMTSPHLELGYNVGTIFRSNTITSGGFPITREQSENSTFMTTPHDDDHNNSSGPMHRKVCPHTLHLFQDMNAVVNAYHKAEAFHNKAGNLKMIENYLNDQMDPTIKSLGYRFIPRAKKRPIPLDQNIPKYILQTLRANDKEKRGGYDQRGLPGRYFPKLGTEQRPFSGDQRVNDWRIDVAESVHQHERWKVGMGPIEWHLCKSVDRIRPPVTKLHYEQKWICALSDLKHQSSNGTMDPPCNIVSIGSNGQWEFEETMVSKTSCQTHTFDCTVGNNANKPDNDSMHFYPYCVAQENKKIDDREYITYATLLEKAGLKQAPDLFKIDVEGFEYDFLVQMLNEASQSSSKIKLPSQISIELHYKTRMYDLPWMPRSREAAEIAMFSSFMYNVGGYIPVAVKYVRGCDSCVEVLYTHVFCDS